MLEIQFVTIEGCPGSGCRNCAELEAAFRAAIERHGGHFPRHRGQGLEVFLGPGGRFQIIHLSCKQAWEDAELAGDGPFLFAQGDLLLHGPGCTPGMMATAVEGLLAHPPPAQGGDDA